MEEEEARHTHYYPFPLLRLLPSFRELPKQPTEARRGEKRTVPHALHCTDDFWNLWSPRNQKTQLLDQSKHWVQKTILRLTNGVQIGAQLEQIWEFLLRELRLLGKRRQAFEQGNRIRSPSLQALSIAADRRRNSLTSAWTGIPFSHNPGSIIGRFLQSENRRSQTKHQN
jgi:hypothetical protein